MKTALGNLRVSKKKSFREEVYGSLKISILHGKLKAGQRLIEEQLADDRNRLKAKDFQNVETIVTIRWTGARSNSPCFRQYHLRSSIHDVFGLPGP